MEFSFRVKTKNISKAKKTFNSIVLAAERNQVEEFFSQSSLTQKPVVRLESIDEDKKQHFCFKRHKLARDVFLPTNLKDRSINGLFGSKVKTTE